MRYLLISILVISISSCGIQSIPKAKNATEASMAEITNQYKRRADLVPNLVKVVKAYAAQEKETLTAVVEARANATKTTINTESLTADKIKEFQNAQGSLTQALGKLMMITERYPDLKSNQNFLDLQTQLEGTENRIAVARGRHIEKINIFNDLVTAPPASWTNSVMYKFNKMPQWDVPEQEKKTNQQVPDLDL